jgi:hypothetical protein
MEPEEIHMLPGAMVVSFLKESFLVQENNFSISSGSMTDLQQLCTWRKEVKRESNWRQMEKSLLIKMSSRAHRTL